LACKEPRVYAKNDGNKARQPVSAILNHKQRVLENLIAARGELDDAIRIGSPVARYDPQVLSPAVRIRV